MAKKNSNAATEAELGTLHKTLTTTITRLLSIEETTRTEVKADGEEAEVTEEYIPPASLLAVAATFLKNNDITCQESESAEMQQMREKMEERRAARSLISTSPTDDLPETLQ